MKKYLITMGGYEQGWSRHNDQGTFRDYQKEAERLVKSAKPYGFKTIIYDNDFIENLDYYSSHTDVLTKTSFGFSHKAICLYETMNSMSKGDVVFFVDSNHVVNKNPEVFVDIAIKYNAFIHDHIWTTNLNKHWGRRDTFVNMGLDEEKYWNSIQMQANITGFCKNKLTTKFVTEWKDSCLDIKIMFGEGKYENLKGFREHRHDQLIFSLLVAKYNLKYIERNRNLWAEYIIPELLPIQAEHPVDNNYRKEKDREDIR